MTTPGLTPFASVLATAPSALPLLVILLKITCVLLFALGASIAMQRTAASTRHLVWLVTLAALLLLPPLAIWSPVPIRVLPESFAATAAIEPGTPTEPVVTAQPPVPSVALSSATNGAPGTAANAESRTWSFGAILFAVWGLVASALLARLAFGAWSVRRIVRRARPLQDPSWQGPLYEIADRLGIDAAPVLLRSDDVKMPFAAGLLASTIVLPAESDGWSAERRSAVLIHELGHVRRRDLVGHTLSRVVCALYWFHPLVWTASRQLRAESERACDDLALVFGARPSDYAEHLLDIVTCVRDHNTPAVALAMAHRREFEGRMLAILNPDLRRRGPSRWQSVSLVGSLAVLSLFVGAAAPVARSAEAPDAQAMQDPTAQSAPQSPLQPPDSVAQTVMRSVPAPNEKPAPTPRPLPQAEPRPAVDPSPGQQPDDERAAVLARTLRTDPNAGVRRVAAWGLQRYAQVDVAIDALVNAVQHDKEASVREMSMWALHRARRNSAASAAVAQVLAQDQDASVRATAVWVAGEIGDQAALGALLAAMKDADPEIREMAAWSIGSCRPSQAPATLVNALTDKARDVRLSTAWALYQIRDPGTASAIDAAFRTETDGEVREGLIKALGQMGDASVDALQRLVSSPDSAVRTVAVTALAGGNATGPWPWPRPQPRPFP